jgi:tRNA(Ile)-lysidine synthase TilS/MesJ
MSVLQLRFTGDFFFKLVDHGFGPQKKRYHVKIHELEEWYHRIKFDLKKTHFREEIQNTKKRRKMDGHQKYSGP